MILLRKLLNIFFSVISWLKNIDAQELKTQRIYKSNLFTQKKLRKYVFFMEESSRSWANYSKGDKFSNGLFENILY